MGAGASDPLGGNMVPSPAELLSRRVLALRRSQRQQHAAGHRSSPRGTRPHVCIPGGWGWLLGAPGSGGCEEPPAARARGRASCRGGVPGEAGEGAEVRARRCWHQASPGPVPPPLLWLLLVGGWRGAELAPPLGESWWQEMRLPGVSGERRAKWGEGGLPARAVARGHRGGDGRGGDVSSRSAQCACHSSW